MNTDCTTKPIPLEEIANTFESDIASADGLRANGLAGLQRLLAARANHVEREQARLASDLGEGHAEILRRKAEVAGDRRLAAELNVEIARVKIPAPALDKQAWVLHGHLRNTELKGQPGLTVAMFDADGRWVEILGHACTNRCGYFRLTYHPIKDRGVAAGRKGAASVPAGWSQLVLRVTNNKQKPLYRDRRPTAVKLGEVIYREIILGSACSICPLPPIALRENVSEPPLEQVQPPASEGKAGKNRSSV